MKRLFIAFACCTMLGLSAQQKTTADPKMDKFINNLMSKMTIQEKIGQLNLPTAGDFVTGQAKNSNTAEKIKKGEVGGMFNIKGAEKIKEAQRVAVEESRLKIPLIFGLDVIHGYETAFPIPLGLAATWDMASIEKSARVAAVEASADGINWTFSPMVDITRDPRWGRFSEGSGEDPFLGGAIAKAMVRGYQGDNTFKRNDYIMACVKHFALYGAAEAGRDYNTTDMSHIRMYNEYFYPYKAAVEAGAGSVMASFNEVDGIPATANKWLMTDVLRKQWGFDGFVVTDFTGISEMISHGIGDLQEVSARALDAGIDMDMVSEGFLSTLEKSLKEGKVTEEQINRACRRILEAKYKLGLFENPYKFCDVNRAKTQIFTPENRKIAREIAAQSFVLLKNDKNVLPLKKQGTIAVVGPLAEARENMTGTWSVAADFSKPSTIVEGLKEVVGNEANILYAKGSNLSEDKAYEDRATMFGKTLHRDDRSDEQLLQEALAVAAKADVIVAALGESAEMSGESSSRTNLDMPDVQHKLLEALLKTGKPVVLVLFTGRPVTLVWENENVPAILNVWFGGSETAQAVGDVLFGDVNPSGKLPATFPKSVGQIPLFYNHKNTGRPLEDGKWFEKFRSNYLDIDNEPLYPFGYGLSYSNFTYGDVVLNSNTLDSKGEITASIDVTNTSNKDGYEVVQLYIRDLVGSVTRPVKELKGFDKLLIKAGETKTVTFKINAELLKFYNSDLNYVWEPGDFDVMIGGNSRDVKTARFTLQ